MLFIHKKLNPMIYKVVAFFPFYIVFYWTEIPPVKSQLLLDSSFANAHLCGRASCQGERGS